MLPHSVRQLPINFANTATATIYLIADNGPDKGPVWIRFVLKQGFARCGFVGLPSGRIYRVAFNNELCE